MSILIDGVWAGCGNQSGGGSGEENVVRNGIQSSILNGGSSAFYMFAPVGRQTNAEVLSSHIEHSVQEMPGRGIVSWIIHDTYFLISVSRTERMSPFESLWLASISMIYIYICMQLFYPCLLTMVVIHHEVMSLVKFLVVASWHSFARSLYHMLVLQVVILCY